LKRVDLKTPVGYDIAWSNTGEFLFVTSIGGKTTCLDTKTLNLIDQSVL
jgi:hypothetical protein